MEALAYAHSYEAYEREVGIETALSEGWWDWRGVPSAFGLHLLAIAALVFVISPMNVALANSEGIPSANETPATPSALEEPPRAAELREELRQLSQQQPDFFAEGTNAAAAATELAKTAETEAEWQAVDRFWQQAIAAMRLVPESDGNYASAREKLNEYQSRWKTARSTPQKLLEPTEASQPAPVPATEMPAAALAPSPQPTTETAESAPAPASPDNRGETVDFASLPPNYFAEGTNAAVAAAELAKTAETEAEWQNVTKFWQQAIAAMESVPRDDGDYSLAREKINEYKTHLETARSTPKKPLEPAKSSQSAPVPAPVQSSPRTAKTPSEATKSRQSAPVPAAEMPAAAPAPSPQPPTETVKLAPLQPSPQPPVETARSAPPQPSPQSTVETVKSAPQLPDFFDEGTNAAAAAAELAKMAETEEEWQDVAKFWQQAIAAMESVPQSDRNYASAQAKINEYRENLETARSAAKKPPERAAASQQVPTAAETDFFYEGANAAVAAVELAKTAKTRADWKQVEEAWQKAIAAMKSVPKGDRDYLLAQEKISEYSANLETARKQPLASAPSQPPASPRTAQPTASPTAKQRDFFYEGTNAAAIAAQRVQTAKTRADWKQVEEAWQKAIAAMKSVPKGDRDYPLAREKLAEYEAALNYARRMPDDFGKGVRAAQQAVELGKTAKTQSEWQTVAQSWQRAISAMKAVTPDHPQFAIASQKIIEYEYYLDSIKEKLQTAISPMSLKKAIRDNLSPKSIVYSGRGRFFVQNMMYGHTIAVYNQQYERVRTLSDTVKLSDYGYKDYSGTYRGSPVEAAFSHDGQYAWVSNYQMYGSGFGNPGTDNCSPQAQHDPSFLYRINTDTLNIEKVIKVGSVPKYVAASPDNRYILASNWCSWDLSVVDPEKNQEIRRIPLGAYPRGIAIDSNSLRAYVAVMGSRDIATINLNNFAVDWIKNVGAGPRHLNLSPDNRYLYASLNSEGTVAKIDLTNNEWRKVSTGNAPRSTVLSADGQFLYVVNYFSNTVSKVRTSDMKVLQTLPTDTHPIGITYDPETQQVWVVCYSGSILVFQD